MPYSESASPTVDPVIVTSRAALVAAVTEAVERAVRRERATSPPSDDRPGKGWLTNAEAMVYLGLSRPTLARYRAAGSLPFSKVGSNVFYRLEDVEALLAAHVVRGGASAPRG